MQQKHCNNMSNGTQLYILILYLNPLNSFFPFIPVIVLKAVNFSNFSLGKSLLSNLPLTCCAGETRKMVCSLECADYVICDSLSTCPAELQTGLRHGERYIVNYLKNLRFNLLFFFLFFALGLFLKMFEASNSASLPSLVVFMKT